MKNKKLKDTHPTTKKSGGANTALTVAGALAGAALAGYGLTRKDRTGKMLAGAGAAILLGGTANAAIGKNTLVATNAVMVNKSADELFAFWSDVRNLPKVFQSIFAVNVLDSQRSEWSVRIPGGQRMHWTSERVEEDAPHRITARSSADSMIQTQSSVEFIEHADHGTEVRLTMRFELPGGALGKAAATALTGDPALRIKQDLRRFKALMETGEVATTEGQPSGKRGAIGSFAEQVGLIDTSKKSPGARNKKSSLPELVWSAKEAM